MKKRNIWRTLWLIGVYVILFIILYLVIEYKVKWENRDLNTYLYFYNCSNNLCTTTNKLDKYYGKVKCDKDNCPYIKERQDNLLILKQDKKEYIYDYLNDKITNDSYIEYHFSFDNIIIKDTNNKYGVISKVGEIIREVKEDNIAEYKNGYFSYLVNDRYYGIKNTEKNIEIEPEYEDVILINDNLYAYEEEGKYYIATYNTEIPVNNNNYSYIYDIDDSNILVIKDKKIDIIDSTLKSLLILKLDTYYNYDREEERGTLNLYKEGNLLHFSIVTDKDGNQINYIYDIKNKKLYN